MPRVGGIESGEVFFLVSWCNEIGVEILEKRICEQVAKCKAIRKVLNVTVLSTMRDISSIMKDGLSEQFLKGVSNSAEDNGADDFK